MTDIQTLLDRWATDEGKPYKGQLIDLDAYSAAPDSIGCMCAQGQILHLVGGWSQDRLANVGQSVADAETAKLLGISIAHAVLLRDINDSAPGAPGVVLTDPGKVLGDQWSAVLDFWWHLDGLTQLQWAAAKDAAWVAAGFSAGFSTSWVAAARDSAGFATSWVAAARDSAGFATSWDAAWVAAAKDPAWVAARAAAGFAGGATNEIQGAAIMLAKGQPFYFLPPFGFTSPADIPARPANYGQAAA